MVIIENVPKSSAELYKLLLSEFRPNWKVDIIVEDYNLYKLGFVDEVLCCIELGVSEEDILKLSDDIFELDSSVYNYEELLYKNKFDMNSKEKLEYIELKKREENYIKYAPLENLYNYYIEKHNK